MFGNHTHRCQSQYCQCSITHNPIMPQSNTSSQLTKFPLFAAYIVANGSSLARSNTASTNPALYPMSQSSALLEPTSSPLGAPSLSKPIHSPPMSQSSRCSCLANPRPLVTRHPTVSYQTTVEAPFPHSCNSVLPRQYLLLLPHPRLRLSQYLRGTVQQSSPQLP